MPFGGRLGGDGRRLKAEPLARPLDWAATKKPKPTESCRWDLNPGPRPYQGRALPTEPRQQGFVSSDVARLGSFRLSDRPSFDVASRSFAARTERRAGDGNRTHVACLEGRYSTIELHPPWLAETTSVAVVRGRKHSASRLDRGVDPSDSGSVRVSFVEGSRRRIGRSRIRTCEGIATRFTVWPL